MLRKLIKLIIPNRGDIFFRLFIQAAENANKSANILADIISNEVKNKDAQLSIDLRTQKQQAININRKVIFELNNQFITPIERGDIQALSVLMFKLTKKIIRINQKLKIYSIDPKTDDCLVRSVSTLQNITTLLVKIMQSFGRQEYDQIVAYEQKTDAFDESAVEDLRHAMQEIALADYDIMMILALQEVYKSIENSIEISANIADLVMQICIKNI
jgi:uncharacterized protein Yka (UPF0111/DUF47 family)